MATAGLMDRFICVSAFLKVGSCLIIQLSRVANKMSSLQHSVQFKIVHLWGGGNTHVENSVGCCYLVPEPLISGSHPTKYSRQVVHPRETVTTPETTDLSDHHLPQVSSLPETCGHKRI